MAAHSSSTHKQTHQISKVDNKNQSTFAYIAIPPSILQLALTSCLLIDVKAYVPLPGAVCFVPLGGRLIVDNEIEADLVVSIAVASVALGAHALIDCQIVL